MGFRGSQPGERRGGRQKGTPNKVTAFLKDAILEAARLAGGGDDNGMVQYLQAQAEKNPGPFMNLLGKVLPHQVTGADGGPIAFERQHDLSRLTDEELSVLAELSRKTQREDEDEDDAESEV